MNAPVTHLRIEVRHSSDGVTQAALQLPTSDWAVLLTCATPAYTGSGEVRKRFAELAQAIVAQMVTEAVRGAAAEGVH